MRRAALAAGLGLALAAAAAPLAAQGAADSGRASRRSPIIDTVVIVTENIFSGNDGAPGFLARLANALHVTTRPWVVRRTILLDQGQPYDSARAVESERLLRDLNVFRDIHIDTTRIDGRLALRVVTHDGWSTTINGGFQSTGGSVTWQVGGAESNLLGTATTLAMRFRKTPDRDEWLFTYQNRSFIARRLNLQLDYSDLSDGRQALWNLGVPFYQTASHAALYTYGQQARQRVLVFRDGALGYTTEREALIGGLYGGIAPWATSRGYERFWGAIEGRRENFAPDSTTPFPRSTFATAGVGVDLGRTRILVFEHLNSFGRHEEIDVSPQVSLGLWAAPRAWGYPAGRDGVAPAESLQVATVWNGGFAVLREQAHGVVSAGAVDSGLVHATFNAASQNLSRQTLWLHLEAGVKRNPVPGGEFDLWRDDAGPRLFPAHGLAGTRMWWATLEDRILVWPEVGGVVGIGLKPFVDFAGARYADEPRRWGGDVGISLRLGPTRSIGGDVVELAMGYRFGDGFGGKRWALTLRTEAPYE